MKKYSHEILLALFAIVAIGPVLYYSNPPYYFTPDVLYVKAKLMAVLRGDLFADPVTGFPTFHPPFYHLILAPFALMGISAETLTHIVPIFNVIGTLVLVYLIIKRFIDKTVALMTAILLPFINQYMGPGYLFLGTAFYFSIPVFLAGLWMYVSLKRRIGVMIGIGVVWGIAFLISPVYFFVIGLFFVYDAISKRDFVPLTALIVSFLVALFPFYIQMYTVYATNMAGTSAFAIWRSMPDGEWFRQFFLRSVSPTDGRLVHWQIIPAVILCITGLIVGLRNKRLRPLIILFVIAYVLTAYHFNNFQYGPRILFFLSLFTVASSISVIVRYLPSQKASLVVLVAIGVLFTANHYYQSIPTLEEHASQYKKFSEISTGLRENLGQYIEPGDFVLAGELTYRNFIMPYFPVKSLVAYKTGEYFQVNSKLADEMKNDQMYVKMDGSPESIKFIANKYHIKTAVVGGKDTHFPGFQQINKSWTKVYQDPYFAIYLRPDSRQINGGN